MIHLLFTGGTISMQRDARAGGNIPAHGGEALVGFAPDLASVAPYRIEDWGRYPACHMGLDKLWELRERVRAIVSGESGAIPDGIVITHGTDTLQETAYLLARTLESTVPIAITGAMRTSSDVGWDGPRNLTDAARVAAAPESRSRGAMVVFGGRILSGLEAVKTEAIGLDAFAAPYGSMLGVVQSGSVRFGRPAEALPLVLPQSLSARVAHVPVVVGDDGALLDLARPLHDGLVLEAFGSGNIPPGAVPAVQRWIDEGKTVVLASRCATGQVTPVYAFAGGGATLVKAGVIPAGPRTPSQARMELTIALSAGAPYGSPIRIQSETPYSAAVED
ncbi:MAG: asparaginase [Gemmatimonadota bacterium]